MTEDQIREYEKRYPVMKDGKQIGYAVPTRLGEFSIVTYDEMDCTKHTFEAKARPAPA